MGVRCGQISLPLPSNPLLDIKFALVCPIFGGKICPIPMLSETKLHRYFQGMAKNKKFIRKSLEINCYEFICNH